MQEITAPMMARKVIGCLKSQWDGRRIRIGVIAMMVDAMPAAVNWSAVSESATPRKGPDMRVMRNALTATRSFMAPKKEGHLSPLRLFLLAIISQRE